MVIKTNSDEIHSAVQDHYREIALSEKSCCGPAVEDANQMSCCGPSDEEDQKMVNLLYEDENVTSLPAEVTDLSLGCGDPITLASLEQGQTVLDLGSGGGIDCFLAAKKVGQEGKVIGVDMTQEMIDRANANKEGIGAGNVEFRLGQIEHLPVEDNTVDVIISNCVINLSPDKPAVFAEALRVLKPGGKLAISDIVTDGELPPQIKDSLSAWAGCVAGAWDIKDYQDAIKEAGFERVDVQADYWDDDIYDAALESLDPLLQEQILNNKKDGKISVVINDGGGGKLIDYQGSSFDPKRSIFSARISAWKPA